MARSKAQRAAYSKEWRRKNPDYWKTPRRKASIRRWQAKNQQKINRLARERYARNREAMRKADRRYYAANREKILARKKRQARLYAYGVTHEQFEAMVAAQGSVCALCTRPPNGGKGFHVDHNHTTGKVRALLCHHCNAGLGHFREDIERLSRAIAYLEKHRE